MTPAILAAISLRDEASTNCDRACKHRTIANEAFRIADEGVWTAVQSALREAFPGIEPLARSVYVEHDGGSLTVLFNERYHNGVEFVPIWETQLVDQGSGWLDVRTRYGSDPVRLVKWVLESIDPSRAEAFYLKLGLSQSGSAARLSLVEWGCLPAMNGAQPLTTMLATEIAGLWFCGHGVSFPMVAANDDGQKLVRGWFFQDDNLDNAVKALEEARVGGFLVDTFFDEGDRAIIIDADKVPLSALPDYLRT